MKLTDITEHSDFIHNLPLMTMSQRWNLHRVRVNFGKQPLELWMFVPVGEDGNVLEEPVYSVCCGRCINGLDECISDAMLEFQQAKERCLFDGFEIIDVTQNFKIINNTMLDCKFSASMINNSWMINSIDKTIECLIKYNLKLTPTALKQLGL